MRDYYEPIMSVLLRYIDPRQVDVRGLAEDLDENVVGPIAIEAYTAGRMDERFDDLNTRNRIVVRNRKESEDGVPTGSATNGRRSL